MTDPSPDADELLFRQDGGVATLTLNRPAQHNTFTPTMAPRLEALVRRCADDDSVRVIVITGAGRTFCGGVDMATLQAAQQAGANPLAGRVPSDDDFGQRYSYLLGIAKPVICALNGPALGIGAVLAMFCDLRFAATTARVGALFVRRGLVAEHGMAWLLPRLVGTAHALDLLMTGRTIDSAEAHRMGLVSAVFPPETFAADVAARAAELAAAVSPRAAAIVKRQVYQAWRQTLAEAAQAADAELPGCVASDDFREGVRHFVEKRPAAFTGR